MTERQYEPFSPEAATSMTGLELMQGMVAGTMPGAPMTRGMNFRVVAVGDGTVTFEGEPGAEHRNPMGAVHGGWALTLIDSVCGCAGLSILPAGVSFTTLETKVNFTRAIRAGGGMVRCEGSVLTRGRTIVTTEAKMFDADGRMVAFGTSTLLVLRPSPPVGEGGRSVATEG